MPASQLRQREASIAASRQAGSGQRAGRGCGSGQPTVGSRRRCCAAHLHVDELQAAVAAAYHHRRLAVYRVLVQRLQRRLFQVCLVLLAWGNPGDGEESESGR